MSTPINPRMLPLPSTRRAWNSMLYRCYNPKCREYPRYGGRGIMVCDSWHCFDNFLADMGLRPDGLSLDRIDNELGYSKANCRWATWFQQLNNRSGYNNRVTFRGETKTLSEWARVLGWTYHFLQVRLRRGFSIERAFTEPKRPHKRR